MARSHDSQADRVYAPQKKQHPVVRIPLSSPEEFVDVIRNGLDAPADPRVTR